MQNFRMPYDCATILENKFLGTCSSLKDFMPEICDGSTLGILTYLSFAHVASWLKIGRFLQFLFRCH